ncbi:MAG: hypothetical protein QM756_35330 [Polyangiaceae bacterium]
MTVQTLAERAPLHDYTIESVLIEAQKRRMLVRAFDAHSPAAPASLAEFTGLAAYYLVGDVLGTILFDVKEADPMALYREFESDLRSTYDRNGGHDPWVRTAKTAQEFIETNAIRGFELSSSIGVAGAIWSRGFSTWQDQRDPA